MTIGRNYVKAGHMHVFPFLSLSNFLNHQEGMFSSVPVRKHDLSVSLRKAGVFMYSIHCTNHRDWGGAWSVINAQWIFLKLWALQRTKAFGHSETVISESVTLGPQHLTKGKKNRQKMQFLTSVPVEELGGRMAVGKTAWRWW